jgi:hypothetical protein
MNEFNLLYVKMMRKLTLMAVCSTPSLSVLPVAGLLEVTAELAAAAAATLLKLRLILLMQRSAGRSRFLYNPCKTDRTLGR